MKKYHGFWLPYHDQAINGQYIGSSPSFGCCGHHAGHLLFWENQANYIYSLNQIFYKTPSNVRTCKTWLLPNTARFLKKWLLHWTKWWWNKPVDIYGAQKNITTKKPIHTHNVQVRYPLNCTNSNQYDILTYSRHSISTSVQGYTMMTSFQRWPVLILKSKTK